MNQSRLTTWQMYRSLALPIYLPALLMSFCQSSILLAIPLFAIDLGGSVSIAALVFSLRGLGNMTADVPAGYGVGRFGDKLWDVAELSSLDSYLSHVRDRDCYIFWDPKLGGTLSGKLPGV